jgi:hypothetical protein
VVHAFSNHMCIYPGALVMPDKALTHRAFSSKCVAVLYNRIASGSKSSDEVCVAHVLRLHAWQACEQMYSTRLQLYCEKLLASFACYLTARRQFEHKHTREIFLPSKLAMPRQLCRQTRPRGGSG